MTRKAVMCSFLVSLILLGVGNEHAAAAGAPKPLTNDDIVTMVQAGLPQDVVIEKIKGSKTAFDTSTDALVAIKKAGVSGEIIRVMVNPAAEPKPAAGVLPWANANGPAPCQVPPGGQPPWLSGASPAMWYSDSDKGERVEMNYERGTISHVGFVVSVSLLVLHPIRASVRVGSRAQFLSCINPTDAPLVHLGGAHHAVQPLLAHIGRGSRPHQVREDGGRLLQDHARGTVEAWRVRLRAAGKHRLLLGRRAGLLVRRRLSQIAGLGPSPFRRRGSTPSRGR
jgi:hypothetical protein